MELHLVWKVLEIEETKDVDTIRKAYHNKLKSVNPEDDQAGFMQLRTAYESALYFANQTEEAPLSDEYEQLKDGTDIDRFIYNMNLLYEDIESRINEEKWEELLASYEDDLDGELQERVLVYIMSHHHFPRSIWVKLDEKFHICEESQLLKEKFPENFLGYIQYYITHDSFLDFNLFEGETGHDADEYINRYLEVKTRIEQAEDFTDKEWVSSLLHEFELLEEYDIYHPYVEAEKLHLFLCTKTEDKGLPEEAMGIADQLASAYPDNYYIGYYCGLTFLSFEKISVAKKIFEDLLEIQPNSYLGRLGMLKTLKQAGEFAEAKEICLDLLDTEDRNQELNMLLDELNDILIPIYEKMNAENPKDAKNLIELGWCYFQQQKFRQVEKVLKSLPKEEFDNYDYTNLMGRNYLAMDKYQQAFDYLVSWKQMIDETKEDGTKDSQKRLNRKGFSHFAVGLCHYNLGEKETGKKEIKEGIALESSNQFAMSYYDQLAQCYLTDKEYQEAYDLCTELIEKDKGFFPAYVRRQEAAFYLHKGQEVIDDFYKCKEIYDGYVKPYIFALRMFASVRQYEDAMNIYTQAIEAGIKSDELLLMYYRLKRCNAPDKEALRPFMIEFHKFKTECLKKLQEKKHDKEQDKDRDIEAFENMTDLEDAVELYAEDFLYRIALDDRETAGFVIKEALKQYPDNERLLELQGNLFFELEQFEQGATCFQKLLDMGVENINICMMMGKYYNRKSQNTYNENSEKALDFFLKVIEMYPAHSECLYYLSRIYRRKYRIEQSEIEKASAYENSYKYAKKLCEIEECAFNFVELGLVYEIGKLYDMALEAYEKASRMEPDNIYAHNNAASVYMKMEKYKEAEAELNKSVALETDTEPTMVYELLLQLYEATDRYQEAVDVALKQLERYPKDKELLTKVIELYEKLGQCQNAISTCQKLFEYGFIKKYELCYYSAKYYYWDGKKLKALKLYQDALSLVRNDGEAKQKIIASRQEWNKKPDTSASHKK